MKLKLLIITLALAALVLLAWPVAVKCNDCSGMCESQFDCADGCACWPRIGSGFGRCR